MRLARSTAPCVALLLAAATGCAPPEVLDSGLLRSIAITTGCDGDSLTFRLSPWIRHVEEGDAIDWSMTVTAGQVDSFFVAPLNAGKWPYKATGKMKGTPNLPAQAKGMKGKGKVDFDLPYQYVINYSCVTDGGTDTMRVVIDPDVVVDRARR